jgi:hypothetical protein
MKVLKEMKPRVGGRAMTVSLWDNGSVDIEFDGAMISFESVATLKSFLATLGDIVKKFNN